MSSAPQNRLLTLPNLLSLARLPLGGLFWVALARGPAHAALPFGVLATAAVTDVLDGWIARRRGADPAGVGSWLDPICDKFFVGSVLAALYLQRHVPLSLLALVVARELLQLPMALVYRASATLRRWLRSASPSRRSAARASRSRWLPPVSPICRFDSWPLSHR